MDTGLLRVFGVRVDEWTRRKSSENLPGVLPGAGRGGLAKR